jgi:hypothetical protein
LIRPLDGGVIKEHWVDPDPRSDCDIESGTDRVVSAGTRPDQPLERAREVAGEGFVGVVMERG